MSSKLTFKKAFGIDTVPTDVFLWNMELGRSAYEFSVSSHEIRISFGIFGINDQEKVAISLFRHSDERDLKYIHEIPTLDIYLSDIDIEIPSPTYDKWQEPSIANEIVAPFIHTAFIAINRFIDSYRDMKYTSMRRSKDWLEQKSLIIPLMAEREFKTYLFYILESRGRTFLGCFSEGQTRAIAAFDLETQKKLQSNVECEIPLNRKLMIRSWEYFYQEDFRSAVIYSAAAIELVLTETLRKYFSQRFVGTGSQIDKFLEQTSNRLLSTVILGLLGIGDSKLRDGVADVFEIRNRLIHGKRKNVTGDKTKTVLDRMEEIVRLLNEVSKATDDFSNQVP
jgi:hypothetical protein